MKRTNGEILRDLRLKNGLTMDGLAKKLGRSPSFINNMEKEIKPIPEELLEKIVLILNASNRDISELRKNIIEKSVPKILKVNFKSDSFIDITDRIKTYKHKVYTFDTSMDGSIDADKYHEEVFMLESDVKKGSLIVEIEGSKLEPFFVRGDKLLFESEKLINWAVLNKKLVAFKYNNNMMIRKIKFVDKKPYLLALDTEVYDDIDISKDGDNIIYIGKLTSQLERNIENIIFE